MKPLLFRVLIALPLVLSACGGGGGGGSTAADTTITVPTPATATIVSAGVAITTTNSSEVAAEGLDASLSGTSGAQAGAGTATGVQVDAAADLAGMALRFARMAARQPRLASGVAVNATAPCTFGGTVTISGNVAREDGLVKGDTLTITSNNCTEASGTSQAVMSGVMTITVAGGQLLETSTFPTRIVLSTTATNVSVRTLIDGRITTTNGDLIMDIRDTSATTGAVDLLGSVLSRTLSGTVVPSRTVQLKNFRINQSVNGTTVNSSITATVETNNPDINAAGASYQITTPTRIVTDGSLVVSGSMKIMGASSALQLTVTSINNFTLAVDANGDGTFESSSPINKPALDALL